MNGNTTVARAAIVNARVSQDAQDADLFHFQIVRGPSSKALYSVESIVFFI
jgi:hypothetical protein